MPSSGSRRAISPRHHGSSPGGRDQGKHAAQQLDHDAVGEVGLLAVAAHRDGERAAATGVGEELVRESCLADPGLTLEHEHGTVGSDALVGPGDDGRLAGASDEGVGSESARAPRRPTTATGPGVSARRRRESRRTAGSSPRAGRHRARGPGCGRSRGTARAPWSGRPRRRTAPSGAGAPARAAGRGRAVGVRRQWLPARCRRQPRPSRADRAPPRARGAARRPRAAASRRSPVRHGARSRPGRGLDAARRPTRSGSRQRWQTEPASCPCSRQPRTSSRNIDDVEHEPVLAERYSLAGDLEPLGVEGRLERGEGAPQGAARPVRTRLGPESRHERVAADGPVLDGEECQQRRRLARVDREWPPSDVHERRPEEADREARGPGHAMILFATNGQRISSS